MNEHREPYEAAQILANMVPNGQNTQQQPQQAVNQQLLDLTQLLATMNRLMHQNTVVLKTMHRTQSPEPAFYNTHPDFFNNIATFDGLTGARSAALWLKQLESTAKLPGWTDAIAFKTARNKLTIAAKNWYTANSETIFDWQSFRKDFSNTF